MCLLCFWKTSRFLENKIAKKINYTHRHTRLYMSYTLTPQKLKVVRLETPGNPQAKLQHHF